MKILVIESSPHKNGSSNLLADRFIQGAREAGHTVEVFDAGHANIAPCIACGYCRDNGKRPCCQKDDMVGLTEQIRSADLLAFVTPLYYFGMSAQLKTVVDRFFGFNAELQAANKQTVLITAAADDGEENFAALKCTYETMVRYLNFRDRGAVYGGSCPMPAMTAVSKAAQAAYDLGRQL